MKTSLLESMIIDFPLTKQNANKLIKEYGNLAYAISLKLYRLGFYFPMLNNMEVDKALNVNAKFKKAVDEIVEAKKELGRVNAELPNKCTDEELNSLIIYLSGETTAEVRERMIKRGIAVISNRGKALEFAFMLDGSVFTKNIENLRTHFKNMRSETDSFTKQLEDVRKDIEADDYKGYMQKVEKNTRDTALSMGCSFEGIAGRLQDVASKSKKTEVKLEDIKEELEHVINHAAQWPHQ